VKVTISIEDLPNGRVKTVTDPTYEMLLRKITQGGEGLSSAEGYAFYVLNQLKAESKRLGKTQLKIPRLRLN